jgi:signal peptidase I
MKMKKLIHILTWALLALCLLLLCSGLAIPRVAGLKFAQVVSGSMEPTIQTGAGIVMGKVDPAQIKPGDIIGFSIPGIDTPVCHRVVEIVTTESSYGFITKGDAAAEQDPWIVQPGQVIGRVYLNLGWLLPVVSFTDTLPGVIVTLFLPGVILVFFIMRDIRKQVRTVNSHRVP